MTEGYVFLGLVATFPVATTEKRTYLEIMGISETTDIDLAHIKDARAGRGRAIWVDDFHGIQCAGLARPLGGVAPLGLQRPLRQSTNVMAKTQRGIETIT